MTDHHSSTAAKKTWKNLPNYSGPNTAGAKLPFGYNIPLTDDKGLLPTLTPDPDDGNVKIYVGTRHSAFPYSNFSIFFTDEYPEDDEELLSLLSFESAPKTFQRYLLKGIAPTKGLLGTYLPKLPKRTHLKSQIHALLEIASEANWDGEGAQALTNMTVQIAQNLADSFPAYISDPEVDVTPHGEVDFDWTVSKDTMLTISVGPNGEIAFAGKFQGGSRIDGILPRRDKSASFLSACFEELNRHSD